MKRRRYSISCCAGFTLLVISPVMHAQNFFFGADLSYVNEMEDCGVTYKQDGVDKDVYQIFQDHDFNLIRLRLWHTPSWYDNLNSGNRYSDYADVKEAISRAKAHDMQVLLDFHLSDNWADPGKQVVPAAWADVVNDLPVLKDSLYNYVHKTLTDLNAEGLLPEMVQIGNETNRGILLSQAQNDAGWVLDWDRNSQLFNKAIDAVRSVETESGHDIKVAIHVADPKNTTWLFDQFIENGVTDFDVMGISYYWQWHQPTTIAQTGDIIQTLRANHPNYEVMIFETGYIWTTQGHDAANNVLNTTHPDYSPASPSNQRRFVTDLTQEVINSGGKGVIYWEPAWVSSSCWTQWGHGSHGENATFFDFNNNMMDSSAVIWPMQMYENLSSATENHVSVSEIDIRLDSNHLAVVFGTLPEAEHLQIAVINTSGQVLLDKRLAKVVPGQTQHVQLPRLAPGMYYAMVYSPTQRLANYEFQIID